MPILKVAKPVDTKTLRPSMGNPEGADKSGQEWIKNWLSGRQAQLQENINDPDLEKNMQGLKNEAYFNAPPKRNMIDRSKPLPLASDETKAQFDRMGTPSIGLGTMGKREMAYYSPDDKTIKYNKSLYTGYTGYPNEVISTLTHERTHALEAVPQLAKIYGLQKQYGIKKPWKYDNDPGETYSRLNELRMDMGLKPGDIVTPEIMMDPKNNPLFNKHGFTKYDPNYTMDLLNKVAETKAPSTGPSVAPPAQMASTGGLLRHVSAVIPKTIPSKKTIGGTLGAYELKNRRKEIINPNYSHG